MNRMLLSFTLTFFIALYSRADERQVTAVTENGASVIFDSIRAVRFSVVDEGKVITTGIDSHGNPAKRAISGKSIIIEADTLPLVVGDGFGLEYKIPELVEGDTLNINVAVQLPQPIQTTNGLSETISMMYTYRHTDSGSTRFAAWRFEKEYPEYHLTGKWIVSLSNNLTVIKRKEFWITGGNNDAQHVPPGGRGEAPRP